MAPIHKPGTNGESRRLRSNVDESDTIVVAVPPRYATRTVPAAGIGQKDRKHLRQNPPRHAKVSGEEEVLAATSETKSLEDESKDIVIQPGQKRKRGSQAKPAAVKEISDDYHENRCITKEHMHVRKRRRPLGHTVLQDVEDVDVFVASMLENDGLPAQQRFLDIYLDASKADEYADFRLAVALNLLHPRPDSTNPHYLQAIKLIVEGEWLYTRYSYNLASPALSFLQDGPLKKFAYGGSNSPQARKLLGQEKAKLSYKVTSTEKIVAKALLGIRGLQEVSFAGSGAVEGTFAAVLKDTLIQPPGKDISVPSRGAAVNSTLHLYRYGEGTVESTDYRQKRAAAISKCLRGLKDDEKELGLDDMLRIGRREHEDGEWESGKNEYIDKVVFPTTDWQSTVELGWMV